MNKFRLGVGSYNINTNKNSDRYHFTSSLSSGIFKTPFNLKKIQCFSFDALLKHNFQ